MKHGKKLLSILLSVVLLLGLLPTSVLAVGTELSGTVRIADITPGTTYTVAAGTTFYGKDQSNSQFVIQPAGADLHTTLNLNGNVDLKGYFTTNGGDSNDPSKNILTVNGNGYTLNKVRYISEATETKGQIWNSGYAFYPYAGTIKLVNIKLATKETFVAGTDYDSDGAAFLLFGNSYLTGCTLDKVTFQNPYNHCIRWNNAKVTIQVQDTLTFSGSTAEEINLGIGENGFVPFNFTAGSSVSCTNSAGNKVRIQLANNLTNSSAPFKFATGAAITPDWAQKFTCTNTDHVVYYQKGTQGGELYIAHQNNTTYTGLKKSTSSITGTLGNKFSVTNSNNTNIAYGGAISNITVSPASGYKFADNASVDSLNTALSGYGLTAELKNGKIAISGNLYASLDLNTLSNDFPAPVQDSKGITLPALGTTGLTLTSGQLTQTVNGTSAITPIVLTADDSHILPSGYADTLNNNPNGLLYGTGLTAVQNGDTITISGRPTAGFDRSTASWPATTAAEATVTNGNTTTKYATLTAAIGAANSGDTVVMKKNPTTAVSNKSLNSGVTLKDKSNNTYTATGGNATVSVNTSGNVTLTGGKLEVSANGAVAVTNDGKTYNVSSTGTPKSGFTVDAATAKVTVAANGGKVTNGNGLTFTAGAANSTFPLDGSDLSGNATGDAITVGSSVTSNQTIKVGTTTGEGGEEAVSVTVPASNTHGAVTVTKGNGTNAMATVTVEKAGDSFTVGDKPYTAGSDGAVFTIDKNGNVKLTSGGFTLADGASTAGPASGKTIENPANSGNDTVTVTAVPAAGGSAAYDEVTVPKKGSEDAVAGSVKIGDKTYTNNSTTADLKLKVTADGKVAVSGGALGLEDGSSIVGGVSGATIANPAGSGGDRITVISNGTKDCVTVPSGRNNKVSITKGGKTTEYTNGALTQLVIDVTADKGATLANGSVALSKDQGIGVYGNTITNNSEDPLKIRIYTEGSNAQIALEAGRSFTDKAGNTYTAKNGDATFEVDKDTGKIRLTSGSAEVTPATGETAEVQVEKTGGGFYTVSGSAPFTVSAGKGDGSGSSAANAKASVTIPNAGEEVTVDGKLTFTAGSANATFPLDGSKLTNNGDSVTVDKSKTDDTVITVQEADTSAAPVLSEIKVTIPKENTGNTTVTKGQPTIVKVEKSGDKFTVGGTTYTAGADNTEFVINSDGTVTDIEAKLLNSNNEMVRYGSLSAMISAAASGETVEMVGKPASAITGATLKSGAALEDIGTNYYIAQNGNATIDVDTDGKVTLKSGALRVEGGELKVRDYTVSTSEGGNTSNFTVSDSGAADSVPTVTIENEDGDVSNGKGLTFTAGAANSTFPLDGSKLNNNGDSITVDKDYGASHDVKLSDSMTVTIPDNSGDTTVTKGQPAGFVGSVTLTGNGDTFTVGGKTYRFDAVAAEDKATFGIRADGSVVMLEGSTVLPASSEGEVEVKAGGWNSSVRVSTPSGNSNSVLVTANDPAAALVKNGDSVIIGGTTYKALKDTNFNFDSSGKVTLAGGKTELNKNERLIGGAGKLEIRNTSADDAIKVTVESDVSSPAKDTVTVPAGGKVTIGGKEYTNSGSGEMKLEIDSDGKVTLADGKADMGKNSSLGFNNASITNTGDSALTMTDNGSTGTLDVKQNGSFTVGTGTVKDPSANMSFTVNADGSLTANLLEGEKVTVNGVQYTGGAGGANLAIDKDGKLAITGNYTANIPGQNTHAINGRVTQANLGVSGATVTLTQGGKEAIKLATVTTGADGSYSFPAVPAGTYNVVVVSGDKTMTKLVTVNDGDVDMGELALPTNKVSSIVEVKPTSPVGAMVGGLDDVAETHKDSSNPTSTHVEVKLTVQDHVGDSDIATVAGSQTLVSLDFTINKTVNGTQQPNITDTGTVLEIILTFDTTNKTNITVYRNHTGTAAALRKLDTRPTDPAQYEDGTYYVGNGFVVVYTRKFSPYAIGYDAVSYSGGSGGSGGSSSGSGASVGKTQNGSVSVSPKNAKKGETVTVTVKPDAGYRLGSLTVTDKDGNKLTLTKIGDTQYTYAAPNGRVEVKAEFVKLGTDYASCSKDGSCPIAAFTDASPAAWYHDGLHYCLDNGLMNGFGGGKFGPDFATTRAQVVMMLWRLNGSPVVNYALDFADVAENAWYTEAIRWAKSAGVANGYGNGTFGPDDTITREQMVTILYRYAQSRGYDVSVGESTNILSFADATSISDYAFPAMQWACGSGMVNGMDGANGTMILLPQGDTVRAQTATMLMRFCVEIIK